MQQAQHPSPPTTPTPPPPAVSAPAVAVRTHPVATSWRPDAKLAPARKRPLAAEILTLAVERCLVIGVTGARGWAEQKSIAAAELALALSEAKHPRVLLVESDFHFPQVQKWLSLDVPFTAGFSQQLRGRMDGGRDGRWHVVECKASLHVLAEGVMRSPGLLLSNQFEQAMRELRGHYDVIVIDAPIAPTESDGQAISDVVDGAVVVGPASRASEIMEVSRIFSGKKLLRVVES
jgi:Mrp family chromosome partitioning ATPase